MLELTAVDQVVRKAASAGLKGVRVSRVFSEATTDSYGDEALRVVVVFEDGADKKLTGEDALGMLVRIQNDLRRSGEDRLPIVEVATEEELASSADTES